MKYFFTIGTLALLLGCQSKGTNGVKEITLSEFEKIVQQKNHVVIDVRTPEEYYEGHVTSAININWYDTDFKEQVQKLPVSDSIVLYCKSGVRSNKAAHLMLQNKYKNISVFTGGYDAWIAANKPVERK